MYVCVSVHMDVHVLVCMYMHVLVCCYVYIRVCASATCVATCVGVHMYRCVCVACVHVCTCVDRRQDCKISATILVSYLALSLSHNLVMMLPCIYSYVPPQRKVL